MVLRKSTDNNTKNFFRKTFKNLKSIFFGGYKKLPKTSTFNPFSCSSNSINHQLDQDFSEGYESDHHTAKKRNKKSAMLMNGPMKEEVASNSSFIEFAKQSQVKMKQVEGGKEAKNIGSSKIFNRGGYLFTQKMKELERMDVGNVDHVLDIEEVLHYYSRLKSPVYLDIVDNFFTDMCSESLHPKVPVRVNSSKRRLGPLKL